MAPDAAGGDGGVVRDVENVLVFCLGFALLVYGVAHWTNGGELSLPPVVYVAAGVGFFAWGVSRMRRDAG